MKEVKKACWTISLGRMLTATFLFCLVFGASCALLRSQNIQLARIGSLVLFPAAFGVPLGYAIAGKLGAVKGVVISLIVWLAILSLFKAGI